MSSPSHSHPEDLQTDSAPHNEQTTIQNTPETDNPEFSLPPSGSVPLNRRRKYLALAKCLILPLVGLIYLAFCYTVTDHLVPVTGNGIFNPSPKHLTSVKSGITAISILLITIALIPLQSLIGHLKSEEFFRTLRTHTEGVPIATLNHISSPSFGTIDAGKAIIRRHSSGYFMVAFVAAFLAIATSTLAPTALTIEPIFLDSDIMAFKVGAIQVDSVYNISTISPFESEALLSNTDEATSIAWAETQLGVRYGFTVQGNLSAGVMAYIAPYPSDLSINTPARWLSDVAELYPSCIWATPNITAIQYATEFSSSNQTTIVNLSELGLDLLFEPIYDVFSPASASIPDPSLYLTNHTNGALPSDGSIVFELLQCATGCQYFNPQFGANFHADLTGIPTLQFTDPNSTWHAAFLGCTPRPTYQTREVRSDGQGFLTIHNDRYYTKQGNLHPTQTSLLLSLIFSNFGGNTGPNFLSFGSKAEAGLIFGIDRIKAINTSAGDTTLAPAPLVNITATYVQMLQSSMKLFLGGKLGTMYVPGRAAAEVVVFRSSLPLIVTSTVLFAAMTVLLFVSNLRLGKEEPFTLLSVAAALHTSDIPSRLAQADPMENRRVDGRVLLKREGPNSVLHMDGGNTTV